MTIRNAEVLAQAYAAVDEHMLAVPTHALRIWSCLCMIRAYGRQLLRLQGPALGSERVYAIADAIATDTLGD